MTNTIAIDCMGGDHGPDVTVPAALAFLRQHPEARVILVGLEDRLRPMLADTPGDRWRIQHASEVVGMDESPALAMRHKKDSSMRVAINLVKSGEATAALSAGNTGALMATARFVLKTLPGIDRPAICGIVPTMRGHCHVLDLGANVDSSAEHLLQFAVMGSILVESVSNLPQPRVALLNIGSEDIKGNEVVKEASELLKHSGLNFVGNVEGDGVYRGEVDVVVCDGFVGNVALKISEGLAQMLAYYLRYEFKRNWLTKFSALIAMPVIKAFSRRFDHRRYNGACLLGLRGVVVKSHGSADSFAFEQALAVAWEAASKDIPNRITDRLSCFSPEKEPVQ